MQCLNNQCVSLPPPTPASNGGDSDGSSSTSFKKILPWVAGGFILILALIAYMSYSEKMAKIKATETLKSLELKKLNEN
jgi:hypothetical protein